MKRLILLVLTALSISACQKKSLEGRWIEVDEFDNPFIIEFIGDKLVKLSWNKSDTLSYSLEDSTITTVFKKDTTESIIKIFNDTLYYDGFMYRRAKSDWFFKDLNESLNTPIELPKATGKKHLFKQDYNLISTYFIKKVKGNLQIEHNNRIINLDEDIAASIDVKREPNSYYFENYIFCVDKEVPYKDIKDLLNIFRYFGVYKISYLVNNVGILSYNSFYSIKIHLGSLSHSEYKTISKRFPRYYAQPHIPSPPLPSQIEKSRKTIVKLYNDSLVKDKKRVSIMEHLSALKQKVRKNRKHLLFCQINDDVTFSNYIRFLDKTHQVYYELRDSMAINKYNTEFTQLNDSIQRIIMRRFPRGIIEIKE